MDLENPFPRGPLRFQPPYCPHRACPTRQGTRAPFPWQRKGHFKRRCDGRRVQRFRCLTCRRSFSVQSFRVDYRLHKPQLTLALFDSFVSKVTHRQAGRIFECTRKTVRHRLLLLSRHAREFHTSVLERARKRGGMPGEFQLDELETYEHSRRLAPVTMPILIDLHTFFVVHLEAAALPARGNLRPADQKRKLEREQKFGVRKSGSSEAVAACFKVLARVTSRDRTVVISSDEATRYPRIIRSAMPGSIRHVKHSGSAERSEQNPLSPINHTMRMIRDGLSRLVRRTWAASKERSWLARHAWIWVAYRNYIRGITNRSRHLSSGQALGVVSRHFSKRNFFEWRVISSS